MLKQSSEVRRNTEEAILEYLSDSVGYTYGYSEGKIKSLKGYNKKLESFSSYGNVLGVDEFEEYAVSLFVLYDHNTDETAYHMYIGHEDGLGRCFHAELLIFSSEEEVLEKLDELKESYSKWN